MPQPLKGRSYWQYMLAASTHVIQGMLLFFKKKKPYGFQKHAVRPTLLVERAQACKLLLSATLDGGRWGVSAMRTRMG